MILPPRLFIGKRPEEPVRLLSSTQNPRMTLPTPRVFPACLPQSAFATIEPS